MKSKTILNIIAKLILVAGAVLVYLLLNPTYANIEEYFDRRGNDCELIDSFEYNGDTAYLYSTSDVIEFHLDFFRKKGNRLSRVSPTIIKEKGNSLFGDDIDISYSVKVISNTPYDNLNPEDVVLVRVSVFDRGTDALSVKDSCGTSFLCYEYGNDRGASFIGRIKMKDVENYSVNIKGNEIVMK